MPEFHSLFYYFVENHGKILFLLSLLFVALLDPSDPYLPFKYLIFYQFISKGTVQTMNV